MKPLVLAVLIAARGGVVPELGPVTEGTPVEVGPSGWAELALVDHTRVRAFAGTRLWLTQSATVGEGMSEVRLLLGNAWILAPRSTRSRRSFGVVVVTEHLRTWIAPGSVVSVERSSRDGTSVITRLGLAEAGGVVVGVGQIARSIHAGEVVVRPGGRELADLALSESRLLLGDPAKVERFLLARVSKAPLGRLDVRRGSQILRLSSEIAGADSGFAGATLEDAIRPAPFFADEVPAKGPNLEVEVDFAE